MFDDCLKVILQSEGGYVNDPRDNGGETCLGVTRGTYEHWLKRDVTTAEMKALTPAQVGPIYRANYWNPVRGDDLPPALALCVFDMSVNAGPRRAAKFLQTMVGAARDGAIGPATLALVNAYIATHGVAEAVRSYQQLRRDYYRGLDDFSHFGRGWLHRVDEVETLALRLVR